MDITGFGRCGRSGRCFTYPNWTARDRDLPGPFLVGIALEHDIDPDFAQWRGDPAQGAGKGIGALGPALGPLLALAFPAFFARNVERDLVRLENRRDLGRFPKGGRCPASLPAAVRRNDLVSSHPA